VYAFLKEASWKLLAELTYDELQKIYELTYKYGWIVAEERQQAHPRYPEMAFLPDRAYLEKLKIEDRLRPWIEYGLEELADTYDWWLEEHKEEGWVNSLQELWEADGLDLVLMNFFAWNMEYQPYVYEFIVDKLGGDRGMLEAEDPEYIIEGYGEPYLDEQFWPSLSGEDLDAAHDLWVTAEEEYDEGYANKLIVEKYDLYPNIIDWMLSGMGWTGVEHLQDIYGLNDLLEAYGGLLVANDIEFLQLMYRVYLNRFYGLEDTIKDNEDMLNDIIKVQPKDVALENKILTFQQGLTTAHHTGLMADHLLKVDSGEGQKVLDQISEGPDKARWDMELEKILGHPIV